MCERERERESKEIEPKSASTQERTRREAEEMGPALGVVCGVFEQRREGSNAAEKQTVGERRDRDMIVCECVCV